MMYVDTVVLFWNMPYRYLDKLYKFYNPIGVAVDSGDRNVILLTIISHQPLRTDNGGKSWHVIDSLPNWTVPSDLSGNRYFTATALVADKAVCC